MAPPSIAEVKVVILVALLCLLIISVSRERFSNRKARPDLTPWFKFVALLAVLGYFNLGRLHSGHPRRLVHEHEQFHHYLGAEYLEEIRYDGIYLATALAGREDRDPDRALQLRDPMSFRVSPAARHWNDAERVKKRFSAERWRAFKSDRRVLFGQLQVSPNALRDHGNTGSPAWALLAAPFTRALGMSPAAANAYFFLDQLLLLGLFVAMTRCFGIRAACIAITFALLAPKAFDYLGGSLLRLDWLFALGMSACCYKVRWFRTAGVFLGLAIASKPFCGMIALAIGLKFVIDTVHSHRVRREQVRLVLSAVAALVASVAASSIYFGGLGIWGDYLRRILVTYHQKYYAMNHSFRDLFLQGAHSGLSVLDWTPLQIAASLPQVSIDDFSLSYLLVRLALIAGLTCVLARHDSNFAFGAGVLMIFIVLVTHMYYWQMLLLFALGCSKHYREDPRKFLYLSFLCLFLIAEHLFAGIDGLTGWQGYFGSYWLGLLCSFVFVVEVIGVDRLRRLQARFFPAEAPGEGVGVRRD